jgi:hypothetical protein
LLNGYPRSSDALESIPDYVVVVRAYHYTRTLHDNRVGTARAPCRVDAEADSDFVFVGRYLSPLDTPVDLIHMP